MNRIFPLASLCALALLNVSPAAGQCTMQFNVSVYSDAYVSADDTMVYGISNNIDNSSLCSCSHYDYQTAAHLYAPNGTSAYNTGSTQAEAAMLVNNVYGNILLRDRVRSIAAVQVGL